jgi:putative copper resistance protein D
MLLDLATAQHAATVGQNLGLALAVGANMSTFWLAQKRSAWSRVRVSRTPRWALAGALFALLASVVAVLTEAAAMAEVPLGEAGEAAVTMLTATHYGMACCVDIAALAIAVLLGIAVPARLARAGAAAALAALAVFAYARSMGSHAASEGDFSLLLLVDWLHLVLISLWLGEVIIAAMVMLGGSTAMLSDDRRERAAYVAALSSSATFALAGIFVTGLFGAWHNLITFTDLFGSQYGQTLVAKLAFVALAAALGGYNRFVVMPPWLGHESAGGPPAPYLLLRFRRVLQVEAAVLLAALVLAVLLASTSPPGT